MRLAHGFKFSRRHWEIRAYWRGQLFLSGIARDFIRDEQSRGAFRHLAAEALVRLGFDEYTAMYFACFSKWPRI